MVAGRGPDPTEYQLPTSNRPGAAVLVIAALYLAAHLPFLAPSLEDIDSINFALGLRHFDPALHQPHPPGYPVYMLLGHISLPIVERVTSTTAVAAEARALAIWSAIGGAACIIAAWLLFTAFAERSRQYALGVGRWKLGIHRISIHLPLILETHVNRERWIRILNGQLGKPRQQQRPLGHVLVRRETTRLFDLNVLNISCARDREFHDHVASLRLP